MARERPQATHAAYRQSSEASVADEVQRDEPIQDDETLGSGEAVVEERDGDTAHEGATPPGYDWPTHGGYLGCLLAVMFSCLLAPLGYLLVGFLGALLTPSLGGIGVAVAIVVTVVAYVALFVGLSRLGWTMGRRYLREYPQPGASERWGEEASSMALKADPEVIEADTSAQ